LSKEDRFAHRFYGKAMLVRRVVALVTQKYLTTLSDLCSCQVWQFSFRLEAFIAPRGDVSSAGRITLQLFVTIERLIG